MLNTYETKEKFLSKYKIIYKIINAFDDIKADWKDDMFIEFAIWKINNELEKNAYPFKDCTLFQFMMEMEKFENDIN